MESGFSGLLVVESKKKKKKDLHHQLLEERAVAGMLFGVLTKLSPLEKVYFGAGLFWSSSSAWTICTIVFFVRLVFK